MNRKRVVNGRGRRALRLPAYCLLGGLPLTVAALGTGGFAWWWLAGVVLAAAFLPVALYGPRGRVGQFLVVASVLWIVKDICTWSEAVFFLPDSPAGRDPLGTLVPGLSLSSLMAAGLALLGPALGIRRPSSGPPVPRRGLPTAALMLLFSGVAYVLFYLVTGAITYEYFSHQWYPPEAAERVIELGGWFWMMELGRGTAMALTAVPFVYTLRMSRRATALATGLLLWVAGGLAPLLVPNDLMTGAQRFVHIIEILTQNAPLGITAALLLRPKSARHAPTVTRRSSSTPAAGSSATAG